MNDFKFVTKQEVEREVRRFKRYLRREDLSENSILSYCWTLNYFLSTYHEITNDYLLSYKSYLMENFAPSTANQRIQGLNKYIKWNGFKNIRTLKSVKVQQKPFLENVISIQDYEYLKKKLKKKEDKTDYFLIWGIGCTGARISEILKVKVEHIVDCQMDFYGKGRKSRRIYFIDKYQREALKWLQEIDRKTGYVFLNSDGKVMTTKGVEKHMKTLAKEYGIDKDVMYPHSFRHMFGKNFYDTTKDLPLLADLMGHASLETTRIYTRRTACEQKEIMNKTVTW